MKEAETYTLEQLAQTAEALNPAAVPDRQVTPRKVRYYIAQGLLPNAFGERRYAYYTDEHLRRLLLIRLLRKHHVPIRSIKETYRTKEIPLEEVEALISELQRRDAVPPEQDGPGTGMARDSNAARDYLRSVMETRADPRPPVSSSPLAARAPQPELFAALSPGAPPSSGGPATRAERSTAGAPAETWRRYALFPGVELHCQAPVHPEVERWVSEVLESAAALKRNLE